MWSERRKKRSVERGRRKEREKTATYPARSNPGELILSCTLRQATEVKGRRKRGRRRGERWRSKFLVLEEKKKGEEERERPNSPSAGPSPT